MSRQGGYLAWLHRLSKGEDPQIPWTTRKRYKQQGTYFDLEYYFNEKFIQKSDASQEYKLQEWTKTDPMTYRLKKLVVINRHLLHVRIQS